MIIIYPRLPAGYDFWLTKVGGYGIGNCLYCYFHAVILAEETGGELVAPTWRTLQVRRLFERDAPHSAAGGTVLFNQRRYGKMFQPHRDEIQGWDKIATLASHWSTRHTVTISFNERPRIWFDGLTVVEIKDFTLPDLIWLHPHREMIRTRLPDILIDRPPTLTWGNGDYAAAHVRMGDFWAAQPGELESGKWNLRIPLAWYANVIRRVRAVRPDLPVYIFSDGTEHDLAELLTIDGVQLRREPSDIGDLLALAQAQLLIGSNSTFSQWGAFLGDMPTIWLKAAKQAEQPTSKSTPIFYIGDDTSAITAEALYPQLEMASLDR